MDRVDNGVAKDTYQMPLCLGNDTHTHTYQHALIDVRGATSEVQSQPPDVLCALLVLPVEHPVAHQMLS